MVGSWGAMECYGVMWGEGMPWDSNGVMGCYGALWGAMRPYGAL